MFGPSHFAAFSQPPRPQVAIERTEKDKGIHGYANTEEQLVNVRHRGAWTGCGKPEGCRLPCQLEYVSGGTVTKSDLSSALLTFLMDGLLEMCSTFSCRLRRVGLCFAVDRKSSRAGHARSPRRRA